jgi:phosphinothricin acetyltransferase
MGLMQIRRADEADLEGINEIYNHYVLTSHATFDVEPMSLDARRQWFREHDDHKYGVFVAEASGRIAGFASSRSYRPRPAYDTTVETSVYVALEFVGRGAGSALYHALFSSLAREDLHRAVAGIAQPNEPSVALHSRFGFTLVGRFSEQGRKFGRFWDVDWYERPLP